MNYNHFSCWFVKWSVSLPQKVVTQNEMYHSPYSKKHPITNASYLNKFSDKVSDLIVEDSKDSVILCDPNIHLYDE